jgi:hypothetical protein
MKYYIEILGKKPMPPISFNNPNAIIHRFKNGIRTNQETEFQKGLIPWNKGKQFLAGQKERMDNPAHVYKYFSGLYKRDTKISDFMEIDRDVVLAKATLFLFKRRLLNEQEHHGAVLVPGRSDVG